MGYIGPRLSLRDHHFVLYIRGVPKIPFAVSSTILFTFLAAQCLLRSLPVSHHLAINMSNDPLCVGMYVAPELLFIR